MQTEIRTKRLLLRRNRPEDVDAIHKIFSDIEVVRMTATWPFPPDRAFTANRCEPLPAIEGMAGIVFAGGEAVGGMGVHLMGDDVGIGYAFARPHWGKGYATEIGQALIAHIWATYDWGAISGEVMQDNPTSSRVLQKLGFEAVGRTTCKSIARGPGTYPAIAYRLTRPTATS